MFSSESVTSTPQASDVSDNQTTQWQDQLEKDGANTENGWRASDLNSQDSKVNGAEKVNGVEAASPEDQAYADELKEVRETLVGNFMMQMMKNNSPLQAKASFE